MPVLLFDLVAFITIAYTHNQLQKLLFNLTNRQQTKLDGIEKNKKRGRISQSVTVYCVMLTDKTFICTIEFSSSAFHSMLLNRFVLPVCFRVCCLYVCVSICMNAVGKIGGEKERAHIENFGDENCESILLYHKMYTNCASLIQWGLKNGNSDDVLRPETPIT